MMLPSCGAKRSGVKWSGSRNDAFRLARLTLKSHQLLVLVSIRNSVSPSSNTMGQCSCPCHQQSKRDSNRHKDLSVPLKYRVVFLWKELSNKFRVPLGNRP